MDGSLGKPQYWSVGRNGNVRMPKYETYLEKKWLERHGIREDSIHLRETHGRIKDKQRREHRSGKGIMNHLYDVEMTWWSHGKVAWRMSLKLFLLSLTALVHGLLPFIFISTVSDRIASLDSELWNSRHDKDTKNNP